MKSPRVIQIAAVALFFCSASMFATRAQESQPSPAPAPAAAAPATDSATKEPTLAIRQDAVASRYRQFEKMLQQMAEYLRKTDPERANLLYRAINQSSENRIGPQLEAITSLLKDENGQLGEAVEKQEDAALYLAAMLKLLQSEDRKAALDKAEKEMKELIERLEKVIGDQKKERAATERRGDPARLGKEQERIAGETKGIGTKIDQMDAEKQGKPGEGKPGDPKSKEGKPGEDKADKKDPKDVKPKDEDGKSDEEKPKEQKPGDPKGDDNKTGDEKSETGKPGDKQAKPSDGKPKEAKQSDGKPKEGKPKDSKPGDSQPGESQPGEDQPQEDQPQQSADKQSEKSPGREQIEQAIREMDKAIEKLKSKKHDEASGHQDEAIRKLIEAKEKFEEILRQLREEERELILAALESRFQKMLAMQILVNAGTVELDKTPKNEWNTKHTGRSTELAGKEDDIGLEADKALTLLKEEGSSVAFPEAVVQIRQDMRTVARRLEHGEVAEITQDIENDIVESLKEMIEAMQKEMEKLKEKQQQQQQQQQGEPPDPALVDSLAELKMLRSLQFRINRRTQKLGGLTKGEQATDADVVTQLQQLAARQAKVQEATYDLSTGKNR